MGHGGGGGVVQGRCDVGHGYQCAEARFRNFEHTSARNCETESGLFSMGKSRPFWKFKHAQVLEFAKRSRVRVRLGGASPGKGEEGL